MQTATTNNAKGNFDDADYAAFLGRIQARFASVVKDRPLFTTDASDLFERYLDSFPDSDRQHHNCHACRRFLEAYGGLVAILDGGVLMSPFWAEGETAAPLRYDRAVTQLRRAVEGARVTGVFITKHKVFGTPVTGEWTHFGVFAEGFIKPHTDRLREPHQVMADKKIEYQTVSRALSEYNADTLSLAMGILDGDDLYRSEKVSGPVRWLADLKKRTESAASRRMRENLVWLAVATAPTGFCHPRSSMASTLLDDLVSGLTIEEVKRRFDSKMHPLQYQRPSAAPTKGNIQRAEAIVEKLGIARSLERRFAKHEDVLAWLWRPQPVSQGQVEGGGVFAHLRHAGKAATAPVDLPHQTMTWEKFSRTYLGSTGEAPSKIEFMVPQRGNFCAFTTAVHADAPPILQWDHEENRNPCAWYVWVGGSSAYQWQLQAHAFVLVDGITFVPPFWTNREVSNFPRQVAFILHGAQDQQMKGNALFPETLKSELHEVRSTIEAYSRSAIIAGANEPIVAGYLISDHGANHTYNVELRVTTKLGVRRIKIDRWD